jgi:hypothetical protein
MKTKKVKKSNRKTKKNSNPINTLSNFLSTLKTSKHQKCNISGHCTTPNSKSGQTILICKTKVFKAPPEKISKFNRTELVNSKTIKLDNFNMNLLIQSVINTLPNTIQKKVEHYNKICNIDNQYLLESNKFGFTFKNKTFNSLEDYLDKSKIIDVDLVCKWLEQISNILKILYDKLQFHHADTKAAQIFLNKNGDAILGDLDKVTFTLNINNKPYRIRLTHLPYTNIFQHIVSDNRLPENLNFISNIEKMRYENLPLNSCDLEIASFIASAAILSKTQNNAEAIIRKTKSLYNNYEIRLPNIKDIYRPNSHKASVRYIHQLKNPKYISKLKSIVYLKNNKLHLK